MALIHDFYLVSKDATLKNDLMGYMDSIKEFAVAHVKINDDLILYMADTINWVPSKNTPFTRRFHEMGLDYYGITIFDENSITILKDVLLGWRMIFASAPKVITLTGMYVEGDDEEDGEYEKNTFDQDEVLQQFDALIALIVEVEKHSHKIYHIGI
ncbi:hypothetical protein [Gottfriedia acidiceleris]|uniref:hypothetical protein n=1 Tax=Gottfriedia acidiceleris TaxID=371036 RepID=UPI000B440B43|nr:hypothetical protein [Gottfriedia acidiceleris]